jgi:NADH-quinone oxidoreductase subunit C
MTSDQTSDATAKIAPPDGSIAELYREVLPVLQFEAEQTKGDVALTLAPGDLHDVIATSRRDPRLAMDFLRNLTAVDWEDEGLEAIYHLYSTTHRHAVELKIRLSIDDPRLPTITDIHRGADWAEREAREMFGIEFDGHPDPRNLLLDEDIDIHPLLKSHPLATIEVPQGADVDVFRKEHPITKPEPTAEEAERAARIAAAKKKAAAGAKKPDSELTPEELAAKKAAQSERVARARELAAARRIERAAGAPPAGGPNVAATAGAAGAPAAGTAPSDAPAEPAAPPEQAPKSTPRANRSPAPAAPPLIEIPPASDDMTPEEQAARTAAQAERVKRGRELAAARRIELQGDG